MSHNIRPVAFWVLVAVWRWGNCYRCPSCGKQTEIPLTVSDEDQQTGYWSTPFSNRISLQFSIFLPPLFCGRSYNDNMRRNGLICKKTGMMKIQKTPFKADIVGNQTRNQLAKISSKCYNQLNSRYRGSNKRIFQWTGVVMEVWKIPIRRWILVRRSIFEIPLHANRVANGLRIRQIVKVPQNIK